MRRVLALAMCGAALAGCTGSGDLMKTATPTVPLQFESEPAGAEVKTPGGQSCKTPCALAVPAVDMEVTYSLNGYQTQNVEVKVIPPDTSDWGAAASEPKFTPSPVMAQMVKAAPTRRPAKKARRVAKQPAPSATASQAEPAEDKPTSSTSGFNPPPAQNQGGFAPPPAGGGFAPPPRQQQSAPPSGGWPAPR